MRHIRTGPQQQRTQAGSGNMNDAPFIRRRDRILIPVDYRSLNVDEGESVLGTRQLGQVWRWRSRRLGHVTLEPAS